MGQIVTIGGRALVTAATTQFTFGSARSEPAVDDPAIVLEIYDPDGALNQTVPTGSLNKVSTGIYHYDHTPNRIGVWLYRWIGSDGAWEDTVEVTDRTGSL